MVKKTEIKLSKLELAVMEVIWKLGNASIREIHESLSGNKPTAYTTIQTIVNRLEDKGAVKRIDKISNAHIFQPVITRKVTYRRLIDEFLEMLGGSVQPLMSHLVETKKVTLEDIQEMEKELDKTAQKVQPSSTKKKKELE